MRAALWFLLLFGLAVAVALLAGNNQGTITVFWPPYRIDLSLNLVLLILTASFLVLHVALRALAALFAIPAEARRWRLQHRERAMHVALIDTLSHLVAGRFIRSRKAAELVLLQESMIQRSGEKLVYAARLRALSHLLAAESAQALQDKSARAEHFELALESASQRDAQETREGLQLRAAHWALADRDALAALTWLDEMPQGARRRTLALRLRLKAARMAGRTLMALETARLLAKHRAFSEIAALGVLRGVASDLIASTYDPAQLATVWSQLDAAEHLIPEVATGAAQRLLVLGGEVDTARQWLLPVWERMVKAPGALTEGQIVELVRALEHSFEMAEGTPDAAWLARIESAQLANPREAMLMYLAGIACQHLQLWGKARQMLRAALPRLNHAELQRNAWRVLAELAQAQDDSTGATEAWRNAAKGTPTSK
jgi:HemY protein